MSKIKLILKKTVFYSYYLILKSIISNVVAKLILGLQPFNINEFKIRKRSNSVYIIGSGASLNEAYRDLYVQINNNDTIGFNYSLLLDLDPTYHLLEFCLNPDSDKMLSLSKTKKKTLFIVKDINYSLGFFIQSGFYIKLRNIGINYFASNQFYLPHANYEEVDRILKTYLKFNNLVSAKGTLFMSIFLAYLIGYKEINLVGIDLYDAKYFFEDSDFIANNLKLANLIPVNINNKNRVVHKTNINSEDSMSISKLIAHFYKEYLIPNGIQLIVHNNKSPLYEAIANIDNSVI